MKKYSMLLVLCMVATTVVAGPREEREQARRYALSTNAAYMTPAQLVTEWNKANTDQKKLAVFGKWVASEEAKEKVDKSVKEKAKADSKANAKQKEKEKKL